MESRKDVRIAWSSAAFVVTAPLIVLFVWLLHGSTPGVASLDPQAPQITVEPVAGIPLEVRSLELVGQPTRLRYKLANLSPERLLGAEITWTITYANGKPLNVHTQVDHLFDDHMLMPGELETLSTVIPSRKKAASGTPSVPITGFVGKITFAEFANGTLLGDNRASVFASFQKSRKARAAEYQLLSQILSSDGEAALHHALTNGSSSTEDGQAIRHQLASLENAKGMGAAISALKAYAKVKVPH